MVHELFYTIMSVVLVSLVSFLGVFSLLLHKKTERTYLLILIGLSAGTLFGDAILHLLPEAVEERGFTPSVSLFVLLGIIVFFILERFVHWNHCHGLPATEKHIGHSHHIGLLNLAGDALHNFIDGLIIAASYFVSIPVGIATTIAVIFHEIPQEIADFGILLYSGFSRRKALFYNFLSATTAIIGAIVGLVLGVKSKLFVPFILPFSVGAFIYIAGSNLIPELQKEDSLKESFWHLSAMIAGILIMVGLLFLENS